MSEKVQNLLCTHILLLYTVLEIIFFIKWSTYELDSIDSKQIKFAFVAVFVIFVTDNSNKNKHFMVFCLFFYKISKLLTSIVNNYSLEIHFFLQMALPQIYAKLETFCFRNEEGWIMAEIRNHVKINAWNISKIYKRIKFLIKV